MSYESVQDLFSRTAEKFGGDVAIERAGKQLTYTELETESNRLANFLEDCGAGKGAMIGLFTDDPVQVITGILGVLKAGGVFVPLDPTFPDDRLRVMSEQVNPEWYVVDGKYVEKLRRVQAGENHTRIVLVDSETGAGHREEVEGLCGTDAAALERLCGCRTAEHRQRSSDPDAACSVYFTSGSTGRPKAILGRLMGIDHFVKWEIEAVGAKRGTRVSQLASPSFDGFLKDAFVPLCAGGVVCAPPTRDTILDARGLVHWLDDEGIEVLHCVPSVFRSLINAGLENRYFERMKCVVLTGELLSPSDVKRWMEVFGERIKLLNIYGTTETSLAKFWYEVKPEDVERPSIPVGKPIEGASVLVIDSSRRPCGLGAVGEVYIKTAYRSLGYYGEPELTKEVFVQNPLSDDPTDIVQRTGDYGRLLKGGDLEILGRRDQQVKVRGVRIELGEIENHLRSHHGVGEVAVIDREDKQGNKFLVAYLTLRNGAGKDDLRNYLRERLPDTFVPSAFVEMEQLPRTLNGKIDRKALPPFEAMEPERQKNEPPRTPIEEIVAGIWADVLRVSANAVGRSSNFFDLGGHSLLVAQVLSQIRAALRVDLPIRAAFESPTVAELSRSIEAEISEGRQKEMKGIARAPREGCLPLSFSQQRMWFFEQLASGTYNMAQGVRFKGPLAGPALEQTFSEIIRRHESLRTVFPSANGQPRQIIQPPARLRLPVVDMMGLPDDESEEQASLLAQEETMRTFDLAKGPLVRPAVVSLGDEVNVLLCTMHHIIADGQSFEQLIAEISQIYSVMTEGEPSPLPDMVLQYVDYAVWQREWLAGEELRKRLEYWRDQLEDAPAGLSLPQLRRKTKAQAFIGARHSITTPKELTEALKELGRREGLTLYMTMLAAFVLLLNRYTGDEDIVIGSVYANRERPEAEKLIGILAVTLVLRVKLAGAVTFRDVLRRVREVCLDAYTYQTPPELLREDQAKRGEERDRLFDVWFQLEKDNGEKLHMKGLDTSWYLERKQAARFQLSMCLVEGRDNVSGMLEYDHNMFSERTTRNMVGDYFGLLNLIASAPDEDISCVSPTSGAEIETLTAGFVANLEVSSS